MDNVPVPESPTGTPWLPPAVFKWVALVLMLALVTLGTLIGIYPDCHGLVVALALVTALGSVLGVTSPGLRKTTTLLLLCGLPLLPSCTTVTRLGHATEIAAPKVFDCATQECYAALPSLISDATQILAEALSGAKVDIDPLIDTFIAHKGPFAACAMREALLAWAQAGGGAGLPAEVTPERRQRQQLVAYDGLAHLVAQGYLSR